MELITVDVKELLGKNITGIMAQVTRPDIVAKFPREFPPMWRELKKVHVRKEKYTGTTPEMKKIGTLEWLELFWEPEGDCGFGGQVINTESKGTLFIQLTPDVYNKIFNEGKQ